MGKTFEGILTGKGLKFGLVISRFNEFITKRLLEGALDALGRHGVVDDCIDVFWTPGTFEIPLVAKTAAEKKEYNAIICLGAIIRGDTPHAEYIASQVSRGISQVSLSTGVPVTFGIITAEDVNQAIERAGTKQGNKGWDAALSAIEMANLLKDIK